MKRLNRNSNDPPLSASANNAVYRGPQIKCGSYSCPTNLTKIFIVCSIGLLVLFSLSAILWDSSSDSTILGVAEARVLELKPQQAIGLQDEAPKSVKLHKDEPLGGLLASGFDERLCLSRYQSVFYRKESPQKPSTYLISRLRSYEALHKRCGPYTESYNKTLEQLKTHKHTNSLDCNYVVWISFSGLGNRILTLASAFLYALLTNRVLLVDRGVDMADLFCEPFPNASWLLPSDFPLMNQFNNFDQKSSHCYGNMLKNNLLGNSTPPFIYLHLVHDYDDQDKLFFCDQDQTFFKKVPWLIMKTDNYFTPSLFLIPPFEQELSNHFLEKETVFHFLGQYLLHPTNTVWGLITRFYQVYLAKSDEKIGIQIRVFDTGPGPFQYVLDQLLNCIQKENLLPKITKNETIIYTPQNPKTKAVLMTSLSSGYYEKIRDIYWEQAIMTGDVIGVYQPSNEGYQQTEKKMHNRKAWAEMYLLSLTDKLVTSSWSTFGYVAQGLGGLKPWILYKPENRTAPDPPCQRVMSMDPCFHVPPFYDCKKKTGIDTGVLVPHVRHCEDMSWGLKLVNHEN